MWDIGSWNINNKRLLPVLEALETRPTILCMQEARAPVETEVMTSNGYTISMMISERKESKAVIAIRKDLVKQATIQVLEMKRRISRKEITIDGASIQINSV